jgi:hypothetical protein
MDDVEIDFLIHAVLFLNAQAACSLWSLFLARGSVSHQPV